MKTYEGIKATANLLVCRANEDGGMGEIYRAGKRWASVIWSTGGGWDHVSVCPYNRRTPTWDEMCAVKDMFFRDDEVVVQYHPAKSEYVNNMPNCLHLWRPRQVTMPTPPSIMVGIRKGQTAEEIRKEIEEVSK